MRGILQELRLSPSQVCYMGDDLPDMPVVRAVGLGVAVVDACAELRQEATTSPPPPADRARSAKQSN